MPPSRLAGFALIWVALALLAYDGVQSVRQSRNEAVAVEPELV